MMKSDNTKRIDQYLSGDLSADEKKNFEQELKENKELREEVETQKKIQNAAQRVGIRNAVQSVGKRFHRINLTKWIVGGAAIVAIALTSIYFATKADKNEDSTEQTERLEENLDLEQEELISALPREIFAWEGEDTVYTSKSGVLISVPTEALLFNGKPYKGKAIIEWQEAIDGATIMKSGLSTMADSNLLETQGMFSFRIQTEEGELLEVDPNVGIYAQVPVDEVKPGMQLYEGVYDKDSIINWVDPKPLEKLPVPVPMSELDFYPKGYEDTLDKLKLRQEKKYRDSLYLACEFVDESIIIETGKYTDADESFPKRTITARERDLIYGDDRAIDNLMTYVEAVKIKQAGNPENDPYIASINISGNLMTDSTSYQDTKMTEDSVAFNNYIPPSKVLAFWKEKFNNTILATREFEKRMRVIHQTCDESLVDLYMNNIDQPLYYVDSLVMARGYDQFERFFAERVGRVEMENPHVKELKKYYERGIQALREKLRTEREKEQQKARKWDQNVNKSRNEEQSRSANRKANAFSEEASLNHEHVSKQLGFTQNIKLTSNVIVVNIDREVYAATRARKTTKVSFNGKTSTIKYNDFKLSVDEHDEYERLYVYLLPDKLNSYQRIGHKDGKVDYPLNNKITYDVVVLGINEKGYFYHEMRKINDGEFGTIKLSGISEDEFDTKITKLNESRNADPIKIKDELDWLRLEKENYKVQRLREEKRLFLERIRKVVFPCYETRSNVVLVEENPIQISN